jgi:hypothetical protein
MMTRSSKVRSGTHITVNEFIIMETFHLIACLLTMVTSSPSFQSKEYWCVAGCQGRDGFSVLIASSKLQQHDSRGCKLT